MMNRMHGGDRRQKRLIDFSVNVNPLGLPASARKFMTDGVALAAFYPDPYSGDLKAVISSRHGAKSGNIAIGNGSIELIHLIPRAFGIRKALVAAPTFSEYEFALRANGSRPVFFKTREKDGFKADPEKLSRAARGCDALFLCNPNNPTGVILDPDQIKYLSKAVSRSGALLVVDEAFIEFTRGADEFTAAAAAVRSGYVIVIRSLTKFFAIPGLRLGYAIGGEKAIKRMLRLQYPWNINIFAQETGCIILKDKDYMARTAQVVDRERARLYERLSGINGIKAYPSSVNFILCRLENASVPDSERLIERLLRHDIYVRGCGNFRGLDNRFFRVAVRSGCDNDILISAIKKVMG